MSSVDILVPDLPESVADATVATWHKKPGDAVVRDEVLVEIETDKVVLEVPASADGILDAVLEDEGTTVTSRQILGRLREGNSAGKETSAKSEEKASTPAQRQQASLEEQNNDALSPAIRRLLAEHNLDASAIKGTGVASACRCSTPCVKPLLPLALPLLLSTYQHRSAKTPFWKPSTQASN